MRQLCVNTLASRRVARSAAGLNRWLSETSTSLEDRSGRSLGTCCSLSGLAALMVNLLTTVVLAFSMSADAFAAADVPGVSAVNAPGIPGMQMMECARRAGKMAAVSSLDVVEISSPYDRDGQSARAQNPLR